MEDYIKRAQSHNIVAESDMNSEIKSDLMDIATTALEKQPEDLERCSLQIKEQLETKHGIHWNVIVGRDFGYDITHEEEGHFLLISGGIIGVLLWKI